MDKIIEIAGERMTLRANALLPRKYRHLFNRDLISDMRKVHDGYQKGGDADIDTEVFENLAWLMLKEGGEDVGATPEEWLGSLDDPFSLYHILPDVVDLWLGNLVQTATPKKK